MYRLNSTSVLEIIYDYESAEIAEIVQTHRKLLTVNITLNTFG